MLPGMRSYLGHVHSRFGWCILLLLMLLDVYDASLEDFVLKKQLVLGFLILPMTPLSIEMDVCLIPTLIKIKTL